MAELCKEPLDVADDLWLNLLQTQEEVDVFLTLLEKNGLKIIDVTKYSRVMETVDCSIETIEKLESCIKAQAEEIAAMELRIKTLMGS